MIMNKTSTMKPWAAVKVPVEAGSIFTVACRRAAYKLTIDTTLKSPNVIAVPK